MSGIVLDLFAGPGGWDEGARPFGLAPIGVEWDMAACQTAMKAGHVRVRADVATLPTAPMVGKVTGLIASPPCQAWSMAGKRKGEQDRQHCHDLADRMAEGDDSTRWTEWEDERSPLVCQPVRWVRELRPEWVALEEVPAVASLWVHFAIIFRRWGYSVWTGDLNSADFGVPQTRVRRILIASRVRTVQPPAPTHSRDPQGDDLFGGGSAPWVSMAAALGWGFDAGVTGEGRPKDADTQPADTITGKGTACWLRMGNATGATVRSVTGPAPTVLFGDRANAVEWFDEQPPTRERIQAHKRYWPYQRPSTTVCADPRIADPGYRGGKAAMQAGHGKTERAFTEGGVRVTVAEGGVLQSFPADYPWQGLAPAPHVAQCLSVEDHLTLAHQLVGDGLQRGVHLSVRGLPGQDDKVLQTVVVLDAVDVVHDLARLRVGDLAVLRYQRAATEDVAAVDTEVGGLLPALVRVERVTVEPPLLPVLGAEAASDGFAFAVQARWLGRVSGPSVGSSALPDSLVVHHAHRFSAGLAGAIFDLAFAHVSCYRALGSSRTKQYQQVGNAVPPLLATHVLAAVTGLPIVASEAAA